MSFCKKKINRNKNHFQYIYIYIVKKSSKRFSKQMQPNKSSLKVIQFCMRTDGENLDTVSSFWTIN